MYDDRPTHRVTVKVALYNEAHDRVLVTILPDGRFGLPGGHIEAGEFPDVALERELQEELGLQPANYSNVQHRDFWREAGHGRIILGYTATLMGDVTFHLDTTEVTGVDWVALEDISSGKVFSETYNDYLVAVLSEK